MRKQRTRPPRIAVCGYGTHGKGTAARILSEITGLSYTKSTSEFAADLVFLELKKTEGAEYEDPRDCWEDRRNHRKAWAEIIWKHNQPHGTTLYEEMVASGCDIIEGIRNREELNACRERGVIDIAVWVDGSERAETESRDSCRIGVKDCDFVIDNNGTEPELRRRVAWFAAEAGLGMITVRDLEPEQGASSGGKYLRHVIGDIDGMVDVYSVAETFGVKCSARTHALKKMLCAGSRGPKGEKQDLQEAIDALRRSINILDSRCGSRIYIAGKMTGVPGFNAPAFNAAAERLESIGWTAINPIDFNEDDGFLGSRELCKCDAIYMLKGWADSVLAPEERKIAVRLGMDVFYEGTREPPRVGS